MSEEVTITIDQDGRVVWSGKATLGEAMNVLDDQIRDLRARLQALESAKNALEPLRAPGRA